MRRREGASSTGGHLWRWRLYKRVRSRADLLRLVVEDVATDLTAALDDAAAGRDPAADLQDLAIAVRAFARRNPIGYALLFAPLPNDAQPDIELFANASGAALRTTEALVGSDHALEAARTVVAWAHGFISMELAGAFRLGGDLDDAYAAGIDLLTVGLTGARARGGAVS